MKEKWFRNVLAVILSFAMLIGGLVPITPNAALITAEAASKVKLNKTKITLEVGDWYEESCQLKVVGTTKKAKWSTNNKSIAVVNQKGKVTAKKIGKTTIIAKVNGKN